jgi:hypothetical protein
MLQQYLPYKTNTLKGILINFVRDSSLCVPIVNLYEYFTAWPLYDGGASDGTVSL